MAETNGILDRTIAPLRRVLFGERLRDDPRTLTDAGLNGMREAIDACLEGRGGEVSARARAAELGRQYMTLDGDGRARFLGLLASDYGVDHTRLDRAIEGYQAAADDTARQSAERELRRALVARRVELLTQFNALPEGVKFLVDMRADLLPLARRDHDLKALDNDLRELLTSWFDIGFLDLSRITWNAPAALLEKLIAYEAVHEIRSWTDMKNRLDSDRRCFGFFHPRMPDEPLIFVEVALVKGMADKVGVLLDEDAPEQDLAGVDSAIFYSISNAQAGLAGVSFGNFLIKRVVAELQRELPHLKTFATLSPIPGFRGWLDNNLDQAAMAWCTPSDAKWLASTSGQEDAAAGLSALLARPGWAKNIAVSDGLKPILTRACAAYLLHERRGAQAADRVEHFHLSNGARLERINWLGNPSEDGLAQSAGLMVNYLYRLQDIEKNHESYTVKGKIAASGAVQRLTRL